MLGPWSTCLFEEVLFINTKNPVVSGDRERTSAHRSAGSSHDKHRAGRILYHLKGDRAHQPVQEICPPMGTDHYHTGLLGIRDPVDLLCRIAGDKEGPDLKMLFFKQYLDTFQFCRAFTLRLAICLSYSPEGSSPPDGSASTSPSLLLRVHGRESLRCSLPPATPSHCSMRWRRSLKNL